MKKMIREITLPNGLSIHFFDCTRRYFGDFFLVKIEIICNVTILHEHFGDRDSFEGARSLLGEEISFKRTVEQMGVPSPKIEQALSGSITHFMEHSLPYMSSPEFPRKMVHAELNKIMRKAAQKRCR